jgi:hypothetical protein
MCCKKFPQVKCIYFSDESNLDEIKSWLRAGTAHPPEHLNSSPVFSAFRVTQSLVLYVCFGRVYAEVPKKLLPVFLS